METEPSLHEQDPHESITLKRIDGVNGYLLLKNFLSDLHKKFPDKDYDHALINLQIDSGIDPEFNESLKCIAYIAYDGDGLAGILYGLDKENGLFDAKWIIVEKDQRTQGQDIGKNLLD